MEGYTCRPMSEICCMEWAKSILKLQVRESFSCTINSKTPGTHESAAKFCVVSSRGHEWVWDRLTLSPILLGLRVSLSLRVGQGFLKACNPSVCWGLCLILTWLNVIPLIGCLGCLTSCWSFPVIFFNFIIITFSPVLNFGLVGKLWK